MTEAEAEHELEVKTAGSFDSLTGSLVKSLKGALAAVVLIVGLAWGGIFIEVNSIDRTVTSHNTELSQTLHAACVLIESDPKLPVPSECKTATP